MKTTILLAASLFAVATLHAQSFTAAPGSSTRQLFNLGEGTTISALGASAGGDLFYLATGSFEGPEPGTQLFRASPSDNYQTRTSLFSYRTAADQPSARFGSFVRVEGDTVYFGESSNGEIRSIPIGGGVSGVLRTVPNHYDAAVIGGSLLVSAANADFSDNQVYRLTSSPAPLDRIVNTGGASGPVTADAAGNLIYGATTFNGGTGGLYRFSSAQVAGATDANPTTGDRVLALTEGTRLFASGEFAFSGTNQYLAYRDEAHLFQASSGSTASVMRFNLTNSTSEPVGQAGAGNFFGGLAASNSGLFVAVTADFFSGPSAVFLIIPEPSTAVLTLLGGLALGVVRRRR